MTPIFSATINTSSISDNNFDIGLKVQIFTDSKKEEAVSIEARNIQMKIKSLEFGIGYSKTVTDNMVSSQQHSVGFQIEGQASGKGLSLSQVSAEYLWKDNKTSLQRGGGYAMGIGSNWGIHSISLGQQSENSWYPNISWTHIQKLW